MNRKDIEGLAMLKQKVTDISSNLEQHTLDQRQDFDKVFSKLDNLDGKFANKWVEKVIIVLIGGVAISLVTALIYLI